MTAQPRVLPTTQALVTDDASGGFIQLADLDEVDVHVDMLTAQGRDCTVWVRRTPLTSEAHDALTTVDLDEDSTIRDAWRGR
jgi:hypothetical protein